MSAAVGGWWQATMMARGRQEELSQIQNHFDIEDGKNICAILSILVKGKTKNIEIKVNNFFFKFCKEYV